MDKKGILHFTIGVARSGKSTFCNEWMSRRTWKPKAIVCADNIRIALHGHRYIQQTEPTVAAIKNVMIKSLLDRGHDVIVDGTHTTKNSIKQLLYIDPNATYHLIHTDPALCRQRAMDTDQEDLLPVIDKMDTQLGELIKEGIDNVINELKKEILQYKDKIV